VILPLHVHIVDDGAMKTRALVFDVHETLAYWPDGRLRGIEVQRFLEPYGINLSYQAWEAARQCVLFLDAVRRPISGWMDFVSLVFDRLDLRLGLDLLPAVANLHARRDAMALYDDALSAIDAARSAGLATCAFTTLPRFMPGEAGDVLTDHLDHWFDSGALGLTKGDPRFYEAIAQRLSVSPDQILCVGDERIGDCELPRKAGWRPVLLDRKGRVSESPEYPVIRSLDRLKEHWSQA
jgi:FMN phosphatase YigB (HAD superfamily)